MAGAGGTGGTGGNGGDDPDHDGGPGGIGGLGGNGGICDGAGDGGAIYHYGGSLTIEDSTFANNTTGRGGDGGAGGSRW